MSQSRINMFLWIVISVLALGLISVTAIALSRAHAIDQARSDRNGDLASLKEQLKQAKSPKPSTTPLQEATSNAAAPTPTTTPAAAAKTPTPKALPR